MPKKDKSPQPAPKQDISFYQAVGRKKESTARVRLYVGQESIKVGNTDIKKGQIYVNGRQADKYFAGSLYTQLYIRPFEVTDTKGRFAVSAKVSGGGTHGQVGALILGIARALDKIDKEKYRPLLKQYGFLTRDPRMKERRKAGFAQKARAKKQSPKR